jgi:cytochrome P450
MSYPPGSQQNQLLSLVRWIQRPFELLESNKEKYGYVFTLPLPFVAPAQTREKNPSDKLVVVAEPSLIKEIFALGPDDAHAGEANVVLRPFLGTHSLLLLDGEQHLRHRKMILPSFHGERMLAYGQTMIDLAHDAIDRLPVGRPFRAHRPLQSITMQIIVRTVFGVDEGPRFAELASVLTRALDASAWPGLIFPILQRDLGPLSPWGRWLRLRARASELIRAEIARGRAARGRGRADVLSMMLETELTDDEVHDELVTLLVAGHETTATSLAWALRLLLPNRKLVGELRDEIEGAGGDPAKIARLELLDDVTKETLRLQPVIPMVGRVLQHPMRVGTWDLPRGALVTPAIYLVHRRPELYPNPTAFDPRRFRTFKPAAWEFLPFGGGLRKCVGASFAIYEMKMVLAALIPRVEMHLARQDVRVARRSITLTPSNGLPVMITSKIGRPARPRVAAVA